MYVLDFVIPLNRDELREAASTAQYTVTDSYSLNELRERVEAAKTALSEEGTDFIVDYFATFFSLFEKFSQVPVLVRQKAWNTITKAFKLLSTNLNALFEDSSNIDTEIQSKMCNITKMITYAMIEFMKCYQDKYTDQSNTVIDAKGKKKQLKPVEDGWDWNEEKQKVFIEIYNFLQMPLKLLWEPPVVDEEFVNLIANFCYKCLEDTSINAANLKYMREGIFQILGLLIKNYLHGLSFCVKVVQLLRMNEHLVNPLAQGIVQLVKECNCNQVVKEIVREIADTDGDQLVADANGTRSLNLFLVQLAESIPETIIPAIDLLLHHLAGDSYTMRICVLGVLGEIVLTTLTKENLNENLKKMRDEFLDSLEDHIHDGNAFVRTKVLQVWQKLCLAKAIPVSRLNNLLELAVGRLNDKSTNVKKQAVHLIKDLLEGNPYSGQLNTSDIKSQLDEEVKKLLAIKKAHNLDTSDIENQWKNIEPKLKNILEEMSDDEDSDSEEDKVTVEAAIESIGEYLVKGQLQKAITTIMRLKNEFQKNFNMVEEDSDESVIPILQKIYEGKLKPNLVNLPDEVQEKIEKHEKTIEYLERALQFASLIDRVLPIVLSFLDSNVTTDVLEAIHFFTAAYLFGFNQALEGIRKMLYLVFSKEANIKSAVSVAYKDLYFQTNLTGRQHAITAVKSLSDLVLKLNPSQLDALEEVVREWVKSDVLDKNCIQVLFERFSKKIPGTSEKHSWAALVLIRMVAAEEPKVIKSNVTLLINQGLDDRGYKNFLLAKETCKAFHRLLPAKEPGKPADQTLRYTRDHEIFTHLYKLLRDGLWRIEDPYYIPMVEEAINLVFILCDHPDSFSEQLITDLHERILTGKKPERKNKAKNGRVLANNADLNGDLLEDEGEKSLNGEEEIEESVEKEPEDPNEVMITLLTRFIDILGQVAANYILYLEGPVLDELKRRNQLDYERKLKKFQENKKVNVSRRGKKDDSALGEGKDDKAGHETGAEDLEFNRVAADDMDADEMKKKTENEIVTGNGFLAKFVPLILAICKNPGKYSNASLQNAALLTLAKFMQVSSSFCEENLQLLVTICEKSLCPDRRENAIIALGALQYRFPNSLEPWTPHMYAMLRDTNPTVRLNSIMVLTDLIVNEMIKVRSHISDLAVCVVDKEIKIAQTARHFFREYSQKGNSLYNVLPSLISNLTQPNTPLTDEEFKTIMKFILGLITKDKQSEYLVEKLCQYFESATTERQWKDLAYCLSLLNYTDKGLRKILENVRYFANKLYLADVYEAFCAILNNAGKNPQKDKNIIKEIQDIIKEFRDKSCEDKNISIPSVLKKKCPPSTRKQIVRRKIIPSSEEEEDEEEEDKQEKVTRRRSARIKQNEYDSLEDDEDDDAFVDASKKLKPKSIKNKGPSVKNVVDISDDESDSEDRPKKLGKKVQSKHSQGKKQKPSSKYSDESSEEEKPKKQLRSTRKRK